MTSPATKAYTTVEGDTFADTLVFTDTDTGDAIDLTGITAAQFRVHGSWDGESPALMEATIGDGITVPTPSNGQILISKAHGLSAKESSGTTYVFDFQTTISGKTTTWLRGTIEVLPGILD